MSGLNRRRLAAALLVVSGGMLAAAALLFAYPFYTDARAARRQVELTAALQSPLGKIDFQAGAVAEGEPLTRIVISRLSLDAIVVEGTSSKALSAGMGHYMDTSLPGEIGNVAIAGHRTMNGRAFGNLDRLEPGDRIELITPVASHVYEVATGFDGHPNPWVTEPNDWSVVDQSSERVLTLTTCHPRGSSKQRLVARAYWISSEVKT